MIAAPMIAGSVIPAGARSVPFFDYPHLFLSEAQQLTAIFQDVAARGAFIMQEDLARFERRLAAYIGVKHAVGVGNATDGLVIALRAVGVGPGDEVIFSSHTMVATAAAIHFAGATPVPVECGADHLIDPEAVERAVSTRTRAIDVRRSNGDSASSTTWMRTSGATVVLRVREHFALADKLEPGGRYFGLHRRRIDPVECRGIACARPFRSNVVHHDENATWLQGIEHCLVEGRQIDVGHVVNVMIVLSSKHDVGRYGNVE